LIMTRTAAKRTTFSSPRREAIRWIGPKVSLPIFDAAGIRPWNWPGGQL
jgi:hypothetical protein